MLDRQGAVIASEAKQSRLHAVFWIAFVADAPNDDDFVIASEAKQSSLRCRFWIASSLTLLAITASSLRAKRSRVESARLARQHGNAWVQQMLVIVH